MLEPDLSVIIVSYNVRELLKACIRSVYDGCGNLNTEIIVVDNASIDRSAEMVRTFYPKVKLVSTADNRGFAAANNQGYKISTGGYILLLNPDTIVKPGAIKTVLEFMKTTPKAGLAGCRMIDGDGGLQMSIRRMPSISDNILQALFLDKLFFPENKKEIYYHSKPFKIGFPDGACMMVRRSALMDMPLLNEEYFMYAEEKDLAWRLNKNGYHCYFVPGAEIVHYGGKSTDQTALPMFLELQKSQIRYYKTHNTPAKAFVLCTSWWLVLFTRFLSSTPFVLLGRTHKAKLFYNALLHYPKYL